ncbi:tetratricopeptide repeat protein [Pseudoalteromonas sp. J010]|nr:tetratricopeptide repeat protein [Pseudoalteromonas sp. J010]
MCVLQVALLLSAFVVLTPNELFKTLQAIQGANASNPGEALEIYTKVQPVLPKTPSKGLYEIHLAGLKSGIRANDVELIKSIINLFSENKDWLHYLNYEKGEIATYLAIYFRRTGKFELAEKSYECAIRFSTNEQKQKIINNLAVLYRTAGQLDEAEEILDRALIEYREEEHIKAALHNNLANVYFDRANYEKAAELYRLAFLHHQKSGENYEASYVGLNLLNSYIASKQWQGYQRYVNTVKMRVDQTQDSELITVLMWQELTVKRAEQVAELNQEQQVFLLDSLPMLMKTEYHHNITRYVSLLQLPKLTTLYQDFATYKKLSFRKLDDNKQSLDLVLSWCQEGI